MVRPALLASCLCGLLASASGAQPLVTDRPDFTESPVVVPTGAVQIELGATVQETSQGGTFLNAPEALMRIGIGRGVEVRVGFPEFTRTEFELQMTPRTVIENVTDPALGAKVELGVASGVALGLVVETTVPVLDNGVSPEDAAQTVILTGGTALSPRVSLGGQVGATYNETPETLDLSATVVLGFAVDDQIGAFIEFAGSDAAFSASEAEFLLHGGATLLLTDTLQLDVHTALGLTRTAPDVLVGVGASARF